MKNQNNEILILMEKLFDAKLIPLQSDLKEIKNSIYGNGRLGLMERVDAVEDTNRNIMAKFGAFTVFFSLVFVAIFEFVKDYIKSRF